MAVQRYAIACKTYGTCSLQLAGTQNDAGDVRSLSPCSILSIYEKLEQSTPVDHTERVGQNFTFGSDCTVSVREGWKCTSKERSSIEITGLEQNTSFRNVPKNAIKPLPFLYCKKRSTHMIDNEWSCGISFLPLRQSFLYLSISMPFH